MKGLIKYKESITQDVQLYERFFSKHYDDSFEKLRSEEVPVNDRDIDEAIAEIMSEIKRGNPKEFTVQHEREREEDF